MGQSSEYDMTYLSLGAGVQSSALMILAGRGLMGIPKPDVAIFADTGAELQQTYDYLEVLEKFGKKHGIRVDVVNRGNLERVILGEEETKRTGFTVSIPAFTKSNGKFGMLRRQCTLHYKIEVIREHVRTLLGLKKRQKALGKFKVEGLIGISTDEAQRMKPSRDKWIIHRWPLIEQGINRQDCKKILREQGFPEPIKSSCNFCPYHDNAFWSWMRVNAPSDFDRACAVDERVRVLTRAKDEKPVYLHASCIPLRERPFEDPDQLDLFDGFGNECEGMCGV